MVVPAWLGQLLQSGFAGLVGGLFVSFLSRRQSIQRFWWEKKAEAYIRILTALSDVEEYFETAEGMDQGQLERLGEPSENARHEVERAVRLGDFLISAEAHAALHEMEKERTQFEGTRYQNDWNSHVAAEMSAASKCIKALRSAARTDLQHGLRWRSIWSSQL